MTPEKSGGNAAGGGHKPAGCKFQGGKIIMLEYWKNEFDKAMQTSINAVRDVLERAWEADWNDGEYIEFLSYTENYIA